MTEYLTGFVTLDNVKARSQQESWLRGCQNQPDDMTKFYQSWIIHPVQIEFALCFISEEGKSLLSPTELALLKSYSEMENDDWFLTEEMNGMA